TVFAWAYPLPRGARELNLRMSRREPRCDRSPVLLPPLECWSRYDLHRSPGAARTAGHSCYRRDSSVPSPISPTSCRGTVSVADPASNPGGWRQDCETADYVEPDP